MRTRAAVRPNGVHRDEDIGRSVERDLGQPTPAVPPARVRRDSESHLRQRPEHERAGEPEQAAGNRRLASLQTGVMDGIGNGLVPWISA